jgi:hypothetical protein
LRAIEAVDPQSTRSSARPTRMRLQPSMNPWWVCRSRSRTHSRRPGARCASAAACSTASWHGGNATLADRFGAAGLVWLVRSATPEFAFNIDTAPVTHGPTRNPWNPEHGPGGSSGGSAALVASRAVPMAHANDAGGTACRVPSLRPPSSKHSPHRSSTRSPHHHEVGNHLTRSPSESGRLRRAARLERSGLAQAVTHFHGRVSREGRSALPTWSRVWVT